MNELQSFKISSPAGGGEGVLAREPGHALIHAELRPHSGSEDPRISTRSASDPGVFPVDMMARLQYWIEKALQKAVSERRSERHLFLNRTGVLFSVIGRDDRFHVELVLNRINGRIYSPEDFDRLVQRLNLLIRAATHRKSGGGPSPVVHGRN